jgi:hypothetical protein
MVEKPRGLKGFRGQARQFDHLISSRYPAKVSNNFPI